MVSCYAVDTGEGVLLFDPLDVPAELRERANAGLADVDAVLLAERVPREREAERVRHRRAAAEVAAAVRGLEQVGEPRERHLLQLHGGGPERPHADVLVGRRRPGFDDCCRRNHASRHVSEVAPPGAAGEAAVGLRLQLAQDVGGGYAGPRERLVEPFAEPPRVERRGRANGLVECPPERLRELSYRRVELCARVVSGIHSSR